MAKPTPTRLHIDPPIDQWRLRPHNARAQLVIATGHQPTLWHPGIFAKDLALDALARQADCSVTHLVVDHNPVGPLHLDVPMRVGDRLVSRRLVLDCHEKAARLPPNRLPPIAASAIEQAIESVTAQASAPIPSGLSALVQAYRQVGNRPTLSEQTTAILAHLKGLYLQQHQRTRSTSSLVTQGFVARMLTDPIGCVRSYNRAAFAYPEARIRVLYAGRDVIELPLWAQDQTTCTPVYADLADTKRTSLFTTAQNQHLDLNEANAYHYLRPRAITLSAIMRSELCDLFIHGIGGGGYDQVTERWWKDWVGEALAPKAVVSADVYLPFEVPMASPKAYANAQWYAHHLPHNIDRYAEVDETLKREKHQLLDRMDDDRDRRRRAAAFKRIHAINGELAALHKALVFRAKQDAESSRIGVTNRAVASRRDWFFGLYPDAQLKDLAAQINSRLTPPPG